MRDVHRCYIEQLHELTDIALSGHQGVGARSATVAQVAEQVPKAALQATIVAGAVAPRVAPQVAPPAA